MKRIRATLLSFFVLTACVHNNSYEQASLETRSTFKHLPLPFLSQTKIEVRQGAFGRSSHNEVGNEYNWDFAVPLGTLVLAVAAAVVYEVSQPSKGGCDAQYAAFANNLKLRLDDGTIVQYLHIETELQVGDKVKSGAVIAKTANNGWLCYPHLHFGVYASAQELYASAKRRTIPIYFEGIPSGLAKEGETYIVPKSL